MKEGKTKEEAIKESGVTDATARVQMHNMRKEGVIVANGPRKPRAAKKAVKENTPPVEEEELDEDDEEDIDEEETEE